MPSPDSPATPTPPQNFDPEASALRLQLKAKGILLVVLESQERGGSGISLQVSKEDFALMPGFLRKLANKMERDLVWNQAQGRG